MTITVAIVDDDEAILDAIQMMLEGEGWRVSAFRTGEAFLEQCKKLQPDCVVFEPHLRGIRGLDFAKAIANARIPIIGLTSRPNSATCSEVASSCAAAMLTKPVTAEALVDNIQNVITRRS